MPVTSVIFSADGAYLSTATTELLRLFPEARVEAVAPDASRLQGEAVEIARVATACRTGPVVFVRHLMQQVAEIPLAPGQDLAAEISSVWFNLLATQQIDRAVALQVWRSGESPAAPRTDDLWNDLASTLTAQGFSVARGNRDLILSVLIAPDRVIAGLNGRAEALSDWPGGRLSLARSKRQVSRSEFKLEELFKVVDLPLPTNGNALDLGASPGGWTRILRERGLTVWAVDPADLDPRVAADPGVHHVRTTAGPFISQTAQRFDLIVNDMRMTPTRSCGVMLDAARRLKPDAHIIMTLKLTPKQALETVRTCLSLLDRSYEIRFVRQLYHNRNEVTVVGRLRHPAKRQRSRSNRG